MVAKPETTLPLISDFHIFFQCSSAKLITSECSLKSLKVEIRL